MNIKPILLALGLMLSSSIAFCQDTSVLDLHNGFGSLSFGKTLDELKKVTALKRIIKSSKTKEEVYTIKNVSDFSVYNYRIHTINLHFYQEQLYKIEIQIQGYESMDQNAAIRQNIYRSVVATYGKETSADSSSNTRRLYKNIYRYWQGNSVTLVELIPDWIFSADTWFFINNNVAAQRARELNLNKGL